ncbi:MAG: hypothetical protein MJZ61_10300, partial [Bacteroidales bacterium]|nr:hypothetical protein [Bacteroidales bacterium]
FDKAQNCDDKLAMLSHEVTQFSQAMGMEVILKDLLDDYDIVEKIIKEVNVINPTLLPKVQMTKGRPKSESTAVDLLDTILFAEKEEASETKRLKYSTLQDIAGQIRTGAGLDDVYMDNDFRILQRTVILTLIMIGAIPLNKNSEPKDIDADNDYAYTFFEDYILAKLPESNMNVGSFGALDAWKNVWTELPDDFDKDDCLFCKNRLNIICCAVYVLKWVSITIINPEKYSEWIAQHTDKTIPELMTFCDQDNENIIYRLEKADRSNYHLERYEIINIPDHQNTEVKNVKRELEQEIDDYKSVIRMIKELRETKKLKDEVLIRPHIDRFQETIDKIVFDFRENLQEIIDKVSADTANIFNILNEQSAYFEELAEFCKKEIEGCENLHKYLDKYLNTKKVTVTRHFAQFFIGDDNTKYCQILEPNNNLTISNYKPGNAIFIYDFTEYALVLEFARNADASQSMPNWLKLPINEGVTYLIKDDSLEGELNLLSKITDLEESNPMEWLQEFYCEEVSVVTKDYIYCKILDSENYYRIKRKNNSLSENFNQLLPDDTVLIFRMKEDPDKILISVNKLGIEMKDITGNEDFEIVDRLEF